MTADSEEELRAFARKLGLKAEWIQYPGTDRVHFDVQPRYRAKALALGAIEETAREFVARRDVARKQRVAFNAPCMCGDSFRDGCGDAECSRVYAERYPGEAAEQINILRNEVRR